MIEQDLTCWQSNDAAFALGVFSRALGIDVLWDLTLCPSLVLPASTISALQAILGRINGEEDDSISFLDEVAMQKACDVAMRNLPPLSWYTIGCEYGMWAEALKKDPAVAPQPALAAAISVIEPTVPSVLTNLLRVIASTASVEDHIREQVARCGSLESQASEPLSRLVEWPFVLIVGQSIRDETRPTGPIRQAVRLDQMAALVNRNKRTLEGYKNQMPPPRIEGGSGKPAEWEWDEVRPWLEKQFNRALPPLFPGNADT